MTDNQTFLPKPGEIIRVGVWVGVVQDVFESPTSGKHVMQVLFAKNLYKQQAAEVHIIEDLSMLLQPATQADLTAEVKRLDEALRRGLDTLQAQSPAPTLVEPSPILA